MITWRSEHELGCTCGNSPQDGGFYTADMERGEVDPTRTGEWDGKTWICGSCGIVQEVASWEEVEA